VGAAHAIGVGGVAPPEEPDPVLRPASGQYVRIVRRGAAPMRERGQAEDEVNPFSLHPRARSRLGSVRAAASCFIVALGLCASVVIRLDPAFQQRLAPESPILLALGNALPAAIVALLLFGLVRRPLFAAWAATLLLGALYLVNELKLNALDTPLMPADFLLLAHLGDGGALLSHYVPSSPRTWMIAAVVLVASVLLLRIERPMTGLRSGPRALVIGVAVLLGTSLALNASPWKLVYASDAPGFQTWAPTVSARRIGAVANLMRFGWSTVTALPEPDPDAARELLLRHRDALLPTAVRGELPDIVVLQSESFFDPARLRGIESRDVLPEFRRLARSARHGELRVPTYGGGTIRTEYEVLTGIAMRYFPEVQYPYFQLTAKPGESLVTALTAQSYRAIAIHPHSRAFWNRAAAFSHLGFDAFDALEEFGKAERQGYYISDDALVDHVLGRLAEPATRPTFLFVISMENHGPYAHFPNVDAARRDAREVPPNLSAQAATELRGYLYHLRNADQALGRLADALMARSRRTLLLFYGDHLPSLPSVYAEAGFDDGREPSEQPVPWLLLDNARSGVGTRIDTASFYLPGLLLDEAGSGGPTYFRLLEAVRRGDQPAADWEPAEDHGLAAAMRLRQEGAFAELAADLPPPAIARRAAGAQGR
jgi:phosphoglycerol transferase MdoB-like AlkP superfamily enzyme